MPLHDATNKTYLVDPDSDRKNPLIVKLANNLNSKTISMLNRIYKEAIDSAVANGTNLVWTRSSALFGYSSGLPTTDVIRLRDRIESVVGGGKECNMAIGAILRIKMAERPENWLVVKQETGEIDPDTGKNIYISEYWIYDGKLV